MNKKLVTILGIMLFITIALATIAMANTDAAKLKVDTLEVEAGEKVLVYFETLIDTVGFEVILEDNAQKINQFGQLNNCYFGGNEETGKVVLASLDLVPYEASTMFAYEYIVDENAKVGDKIEVSVKGIMYGDTIDDEKEVDYTVTLTVVEGTVTENGNTLPEGNETPENNTTTDENNTTTENNNTTTDTNNNTQNQLDETPKTGVSRYSSLFVGIALLSIFVMFYVKKYNI